MARAKNTTNRIRAAAAAGVAALAFALASSPAARAESLRCAGTSVSVRGVDRAEAQSACQGVVAAVTFLASLGLDTSAAAEMRLVEALPAIQGGAAAYGCKVKSDEPHLCAEPRRVPEAPAGARRAGRRRRAPRPRRARSGPPHRGGQLPDGRADRSSRTSTSPTSRCSRRWSRRRGSGSCAQFPGEGFESAREIGLTIYLMDPNRFGAYAYRHFMRPGNGASFIEQVLSGRALATEDPP